MHRQAGRILTGDFAFLPRPQPDEDPTVPHGPVGCGLMRWASGDIASPAGVGKGGSAAATSSHDLLLKTTIFCG